MNIKNEMERAISNTENNNTFYIRNLVKEILQNYLLNYIYNSSYNNFIFTGGTCLRKVYGLNRLSEDLDFDYMKKIDMEKFSQDVKKYFTSSLKLLGVSTKITNRESTLIIKFPLDTLLDSKANRISSDVVFLRCDLSKVRGKSYNTERNLIYAGKFSFFVNSYDLPTLFANKIIAFLERSFYKGKLQKYPFKGRDVYDLFWLINMSASSQFSIKPNKKRVVELSRTKKSKDLAELVKSKLKQVDPKFVYEDLLPMVESVSFLDQFIANYEDVINNKIDYVL